MAFVCGFFVCLFVFICQKVLIFLTSQDEWFVMGGKKREFAISDMTGKHWSEGCTQGMDSSVAYCHKEGTFLS